MLSKVENMQHFEGLENIATSHVIEPTTEDGDAKSTCYLFTRSMSDSKIAGTSLLQQQSYLCTRFHKINFKGQTEYFCTFGPLKCLRFCSCLPQISA